MDKVKLALAIARKYHFWAFCACVVISADRLVVRRQ